MAYNLECAQDKDRRAAMQTLMKEVGIPKIPDAELERPEAFTNALYKILDRS